MNFKRLVLVLGAVFWCGCFFQVSDQAQVILVDVDLFDKKQKLTRSIGIEISNGVFHAILPSGSRTPSADAIVFQPNNTGEQPIKLSFYQGLSANVSENTLIGSYLITGILPGSKETKVQLVLAAEKGKIFAEAVELSTNRILALNRLETPSGMDSSPVIPKPAGN